MEIIWNEPFAASDNLDTMILGRIDGRKVLARLCEEAIEDHGLERCRATAEQKIRAASKFGPPPDETVVKTNDVPPAGGPRDKGPANYRQDEPRVA